MVEERYVRPLAQFQLKSFDTEEDKRGLETETPYMLDPHGSPYRNAPLGVTFPTSRRDWRFDANENRLNGAYKKWDDIRYRQIRHTTDSTNNARTDALQDIQTIGGRYRQRPESESLPAGSSTTPRSTMSARL